jgi:hypothetical protein
MQKDSLLHDRHISGRLCNFLDRPNTTARNHEGYTRTQDERRGQHTNVKLLVTA